MTVLAARRGWCLGGVGGGGGSGWEKGRQSDSYLGWIESDHFFLKRPAGILLHLIVKMMQLTAVADTGLCGH